MIMIGLYAVAYLCFHLCREILWPFPSFLTVITPLYCLLMCLTQITAVGFSDGADKIFTGGIDNDIKVWDLRKHEVAMKLQGHTETITSMQLSPDGSYLLTNSMDCTLRVWDMRPYAPQVCLLRWNQQF